MKIKKIVGVPGSGKTKTMLDLFEHELKATPPDRTAFLTFTRAAKQEALSRSGRTQEELPFLRTIHSICYRQLGLTSDRIVSPRDLRELGIHLGIPLGGVPDPWAAEEFGSAHEAPTPGDLLLQLNHLGRHRRIGLKEALDITFDMDFHTAKWLTAAYRDWRTAESKVDFTDMLTRYLDHGQPLPIDVMFIDEGQDLSKLQWEVVNRLGENAKRWYIVADPDQCIFSWAGASADLFRDYPADETVFLERSYRVPRTVLEIARQILYRIQDREVKRIVPRDEDGSVEIARYLDTELARSDDPTLVLFRNHYRGRAIAVELEEAGLPFGGSHAALSRSATRAAAAARYRVERNEPLWPEEIRSLIKNLGEPWVATGVRPIRGRTLPVASVMRRIPTADQWPVLLARVPGLDYVDRVVRRYGWEALWKPRVNLMSIHQAKGRQADRVILDLAMAERTFEGFWGAPDDEHRVWYVAVTRTFRDLRLLVPDEFRNYEI